MHLEATSIIPYYSTRIIGKTIINMHFPDAGTGEGAAGGGNTNTTSTGAGDRGSRLE